MQIQGFEAFYEFTRAYEDLQLDNIALALVPGSLVLAVVAGLRFRDSRRSERVLRSLMAEREEALERENALRAVAEDANKAKSLFLANMSHELRTPLNAIIGYTEMVAEEIEASADVSVSRDLERVLQSSRHLLELINDVLDLAKIEAGKTDVEISAFRPAEVIGEVLAAAGPLASKSGAKISWQASDLGLIRSDRRKLKQCLLNLVSNACKFAPDGKVEIQARRFAPNHLDLIVTDTGIGMDAEQVSRVFEPFHQADATITKRFGGTGLGLSISRQLARMLGGDIWFESTPGKGTIAFLRVRTNSAETRQAA